MERLAHFLLDSARGRIMLLTALMLVFLLGLHSYRRAVEHHHPRLARLLQVLGGVVVIVILFDLFGLLDVLLRR